MDALRTRTIEKPAKKRKQIIGNKVRGRLTRYAIEDSFFLSQKGDLFIPRACLVHSIIAQFLSSLFASEQPRKGHGSVGEVMAAKFLSFYINISLVTISLIYAIGEHDREVRTSYPNAFVSSKKS